MKYAPSHDPNSTSFTNDDVAKLMIAATERLVENDYDAAAVHLKSAINVLVLLRKHARNIDKIPGIEGDVINALEGLGADPQRARAVVRDVLRSGVTGFENIFRVALAQVRKAA